MRTLLILTLAAATLACHVGAAEERLRSPLYDEAFWDHWGDGRAELAGYELTYPRYGELRRGTAVTVFVTESFSHADRVKAEMPRRRDDDVFPVLKLNLMQDFTTGIYDYNMMTSTFLALQPIDGLPGGVPTKVSFSAQEWCGMSFSQLLFDEEGVRHEMRSYFDGEGDDAGTLEHFRDGLSEDALLLWARGLAAPVLEPGESRAVRLLRSLESARLGHLPVEWQRARLSRSNEPRRLSVPAGELEVEVLTVATEPVSTVRTYGSEKVQPAALEWTFFVERDAPKRIVRWTRSDGLEASLLGSTRVAYWTMEADGFERALADLGLEPRPPRTP